MKTLRKKIASTAAIVAIFFCLFFPNRFTHMGGSILRFDYAAALLIVEAGDIGSKAELVKVFESADNAGAMGCYRDSETQLGPLIAAHLKAGGYGIARDARYYFVHSYAGPVNEFTLATATHGAPFAAAARRLATSSGTPAAARRARVTLRPENMLQAAPVFPTWMM